MTGDRGRAKHGQRPELQKQYGYDVKAAMHVLRLLHEGIEFVSRGWVTLPPPTPSGANPSWSGAGNGHRTESWQKPIACSQSSMLPRAFPRLAHRGLHDRARFPGF